MDPLVEGVVEWLPERRFWEQDVGMFWFHDLLHSGPPVTPMGASVLHWPRGAAFAAEAFSLPYSRGFDFVLCNGRVYPGPILVADANEVQERLSRFEAVLDDVLERWLEYYQTVIAEWNARLGYLRGVRKDSLPLDKLLAVLLDAVSIAKRSWELHFMAMYPSFAAYERLGSVCRRLGIDETMMPVLLQGYETKMYEVDRALWWLAELAESLGLRDVFVDLEDLGDLHESLPDAERGAEWLQEFGAFLDRHGRRSTAAVLDPYYPTWLEDPYPALATIRTYVMKGGFDFEEHSRGLVEGRERALAETLSGITGEDDRRTFLRVLRDAQNTYPFNEDHNYYVEQWTYAELRYAIHECGRRLHGLGVIAGTDPDDVFFLTIDELQAIMTSLIEDEPGGAATYKRRIPAMVSRRKETWRRLHDVDTPPFIGSLPEESYEDPVFTKIWGLSRNMSVGQSLMGAASDGVVRGMCGGPGVVEGYARVVEGYEDFGAVQPDDILVAPFTTPAWSPVFSKIGGVVTDLGGVLAHAAICAREYGVPSVVGTVAYGVKATRVIKSGDRVRVDGTKGLVYILRD